jgi:hypothetical protein
MELGHPLGRLRNRVGCYDDVGMVSKEVKRACAQASGEAWGPREFTPRAEGPTVPKERERQWGLQPKGLIFYFDTDS